MGKKILVVDDNAVDRKIVTKILNREGFYDIITAESGEEGLMKARTENPDLIILDVMLPKIDGYKICRMLKFDAKYKNIPIILFTSRAKHDDEQIGKEVGADGYLTKQFDNRELVAKIREFLPDK